MGPCLCCEACAPAHAPPRHPWSRRRSPLAASAPGFGVSIPSIPVLPRLPRVLKIRGPASLPGAAGTGGRGGGRGSARPLDSHPRPGAGSRASQSQPGLSQGPTEVGGAGRRWHREAKVPGSWVFTAARGSEAPAPSPRDQAQPGLPTTKQPAQGAGPRPQHAPNTPRSPRTPAAAHSAGPPLLQSQAARGAGRGASSVWIKLPLRTPVTSQLESEFREGWLG